MVDMSKVDLNAPAFGQGSQKLEDLMNEASKANSVEEKEEVKVEEKEEEEIVEPVGETKVPYSRFKNVNEARREAEAEAEKWRARAEELEQIKYKPRGEDPSEMPASWVKLYGDSEASKEAWAVQEQREMEIERRAYEAGQRGAQELKQVEQQRLNENLSVIDENFEDLTAIIGRDLTEKEQSAILDIVDTYTAKDSEGNYAGQVMPFDKAWDIYELKQNSGKVAQRKSRDNVASLSGTNTQGEPDIKEEQNKNFNPLNWGAWRNRV